MVVTDLLEVLKKNDLTRAVPPAELEELASRLTVEVFQLGESVVRRGERGDAFYIVYSGRARVVDDSVKEKPVTLAVLTAGDGFGERALFRDEPRGHTVRAAGTLTVLKLQADAFRALVAAHPELTGTLETRIRQQTEFNFLKQLGILAHLSPAKTQELLGQLERRELQDGELLFQEGEPGDSAFLVREGRIQILKQDGLTSRQVSVLSAGALLGEISLLYGAPRAASARAEGPATVLRMSAALLEQYVATEDTKALILQQATNRLQQNDTLLMQEPAAAEPEAERPGLHSRPAVLGHGLLARTLPVVVADVPALAGLACLAMIDAAHRRTPPSDREVDRRLTQPSQATLLSLARDAEQRGYFTRLLKLSLAELSDVPLPCLAERNDGSCVIVFKVDARQVAVAHPLTGLERLSAAEFAAAWNGRLLTVTPAPVFAESGGRLASIFRQMAAMARPYRDGIAAVAAITLMTQVFGLAGPLFTQVIVDKVLVSGDRSLLHLLLVGSLVVTAFQLGAGTLREYLVAHLVRRLNGLMQLRFFHHILALPQKTIVRWTVGDLLLRFGENEKLLALVSQSGLKIVLDSTTIVMYAFILLAQNATLAGVAIVFLLGFVALMLFSSPRLRAGDRLVFASAQATQSHLIETVTGIQTVKSLAAEGTTFTRGYGLITDQQVRERRFAGLTFNISLISTALNQSASVVILGFGAVLTLKGELTTGELVAFNGIFAAMVAPVMGLVKVWDELQEVRVSFERTGEILREPAEREPADAVAPLLQGHVVFRNVSFRYGEEGENVLSDVSFEAFPGQKVALVGRSGSGKTTLASLLIDLYQPTEGAIVVDQVDIRQMSKTALRRQVGVVEQAPFLFSGTIRENIARSDPGADLERIVAASTIAGAHAFVSQLPLGYDTPIGERGTSLSGGQRQRLVIARAILGNPRILILDEATSALDTESEHLIQKNLDSVMKGRTSFVIAHRLSTVRNADLILVMDKGRLVESGTHAELMERHGLYHYLNASAA